MLERIRPNEMGETTLLRGLPTNGRFRESGIVLPEGLKIGEAKVTECTLRRVFWKSLDPLKKTFLRGEVFFSGFVTQRGNRPICRWISLHRVNGDPCH